MRENASERAYRNRKERTKWNHVRYMNISSGHLSHQWYSITSNPQKRLRASKWCSCSRCSRLETKSSSRNILTGERERVREREFLKNKLAGLSLRHLIHHNSLLNAQKTVIYCSWPDQGCQAVWRFQSFSPRGAGGGDSDLMWLGCQRWHLWLIARTSTAGDADDSNESLTLAEMRPSELRVRHLSDWEES